MVELLISPTVTLTIVPTVSSCIKFGVSPSPNKINGSWRAADEDLGVATVIWVWPDLPVVEYATDADDSTEPYGYKKRTGHNGKRIK